MTRSLKILGLASALVFAASLTDAGGAVLWGALKPASAILFIVFFIGTLLHKAVAEYDRECRLAILNAPATPNPAAPAPVCPVHGQTTAIPAAAH